MITAPVRRARPVRRRDPEDERRRILAAAAGFLGRERYHAMTAARVAAAAGASGGLILHHFGSKRGVLVTPLLSSMVVSTLTGCFVRGNGDRMDDWLLGLSRCVDAAMLHPPEVAAAAGSSR